MKKTILSLVCLIMMSAMSISAKGVVYVSNHQPAQRTAIVVVHNDKKQDKKHVKKHHGQHKACKKCAKWRTKHVKQGAKINCNTHKHNVRR